MSDLTNNWTFYGGAFLAVLSISVVIMGWAISLATKRHRLNRLSNPLALFLVVYLGFLGMSFLRPFFDIYYVPSVQSQVYYVWTADFLTVGLYLLGGLSFVAGFIVFPSTAKRYGWTWRWIVGGLFDSVKSILRSRKLHYFFAAVIVLWVIGLAANLALFIQVRGIPLFDIKKRDLLDPKLTLLSELQPLLVILAPFVLTLRAGVPARFRFFLHPVTYGLMIVASMIAFTLLGARNLPAKLGLSLLLLWVLSPTKSLGGLRRKAAIVGAAGLLVFVTIGVAGAFTKVEIYHMSFQELPSIVLGSPISDSIGNVYSFQILVNYSGTFGHFHGDLLRTTYLSYIPGREERYANYIVGEIVGYSPQQLNSISSTFNGPPLLDFGVLGVIVNSALFGYILAYGWTATKDSARNLGALSLLLTTLMLDIHLGTYNIWTSISVIVLVVCVEFNRIP